MDLSEMNTKIEQIVTAIQQEIAQMPQREALKQVWEERKELEALLHNKDNLLLMIAGNIGLGKTTAGSIIGTFGKIPEINEPLDNPLLKLYYENMGRYAEPLQIDLINWRLWQLVLHLKERKTSLVSDRTHYEDPYVFCEALCKTGLMSEDSRDFCQRYFQMKKDRLERDYTVSLTPDLVIFLSADIETGWNRCQNRGREMEIRDDATLGVGLPREFYQALHQEYDIFKEKMPQLYPGPTLFLPQDKVEVVDATNTKGQLYVVRSVKEALKIAVHHREQS